MKYDIKCTNCGKFIKYTDLEKCKRSFVPNSDVSYEEDLTHCIKCTIELGKPVPRQTVNMLFV